MRRIGSLDVGKLFEQGKLTAEDVKHLEKFNRIPAGTQIRIQTPRRVGEGERELFRNLDNPVLWEHDCPALKRVTTSVSDLCEYCGVERPQASTDPED